MLPVLHNVDSGIKRLLAAPADVRRADASALRNVKLAAAPPHHLRLFDQYCRELAPASEEAEDWWNAMLDRARGRAGSDDAALRSLYDLRPAGPASYPSIVSVVRKYWLACDLANKSVPPGIAPETVLIAWTVERGLERELRVLTALPYWPIGMDAEGNWV